MSNNDVYLGFCFLFVVLGFSGLIYFLLKYRTKFLAKNLQLKAIDVWPEIQEKALCSGLGPQDLLYGIWQDRKDKKDSWQSVGELIIKDSQSQIISSIPYPWSREVLSSPYLVKNLIFIIH